MSELKKAHAALSKAMKQKTKILEVEEIDEAMHAESPVELSDSELESLVQIVREETELKIEYVSDSEESSPGSPEIPLILPGFDYSC